MDEFLSQAAFSRARGVSRKQVTVWKQTGLLVLRGKLVDTAKSEALIDARPSQYRGGVANRRKTTTTKPVAVDSVATDADAAAPTVATDAVAVPAVTMDAVTTKPRRKTYKVRKLEPEDIIEAELDKLLPDAASWSHAEATRRKECALALTRQLEYDLKAANVVEIAKVAETVAAEYSIVRDRLLQLPGKAADRVCGLDRYTVEKILRDEVYEALTALSVHGGPDDDRSKA